MTSVVITLHEFTGVMNMKCLNTVFKKNQYVLNQVCLLILPVYIYIYKAEEAANLFKTFCCMPFTGM